jgi:protein phosphatase
LKKYSAVTDVGKKRTNNQDSYFVSDKWCVVADGMGGHNGGEVASRTAIDIIKKSLMQQSINIEILLRNAIYNANTAVYNMSLEDPSLEGMGTTAVLCYLDENEAIIAHVGDSRAYHISPLGMRQITSDHSIVQQLIESGTITPQEAKNHPQKNLITRAIGTESSIDVDISHLEFCKGDFILLCTDGLTAFVSDKEIESVIKENGSDTQSAANKLVGLANSGGGADNITVILIQL